MFASLEIIIIYQSNNKYVIVIYVRGICIEYATTTIVEEF